MLQQMNLCLTYILALAMKDTIMILFCENNFRLETLSDRESRCVLGTGTVSEMNDVESRPLELFKW